MNKFVILVTRPDPFGSELCALINAQGDEAIHFPTIEFLPPHDITLMEQGIDALGEQHWIIFVSPQAVIASVPSIRRVWPHLPPTVQMAAVGQGTANALRDAGYHAIYPKHDWSAEGLLAMDEFNDVAGKKIAIVRGEGGREVLESVLRERQADVKSVVMYRRALPSLRGRVSGRGNPDPAAIICTSGASVINLNQMLAASLPTLHTTPLIVVSERIKKLAEELGFKTIWVAKNASHEAIIEVLNHVQSVQ